MALYWRITRDTVNPEPEWNRKGKEGPLGCVEAATPVRFRLTSDDWPEDRGAYYGVAANDESVELALDGFGIPDAGLCSADIWNPSTQKWENFIS